MVKNNFLNNIIFTFSLIVLSIIMGAPVALLAMSVHLLASAYLGYVYIIILAVSLVCLLIYRKYNKKNREVIFWILVILLIPVLFLAGYPLLQLEEYITGVDSGEKYILGVLLYLCVPATTGYVSLAFVYFLYKRKSVCRLWVIIAFIYFIITIILGFAVLIHAYS